MVGIVAMVGHNALYSYLDGKTSTTLGQSFVSGIATACILVFRTAATALIMTSYNQQVWFGFKQKICTGSEIDALMSGPFSWTFYLKPTLLVRAPVAWFMAMTCWIIPVAVLFPPGSLSVNPAIQSFNSSVAVPFIDWSRPEIVYKLIQTHSNGISPGAYDSPSLNLSAGIWQSIIEQRIIPLDPPCSDGNCSYSLDVISPVFSCVNQTEAFSRSQIPSQLGPYMIECALQNDVFWMWYYIPFPNAISCTTLVGQHTVIFNWTNGVFSVERIDTETLGPLDWSSTQEIFANVSVEPTPDQLKAVGLVAITDALTTAINGTVYTDSRTFQNVPD